MMYKVPNPTNNTFSTFGCFFRVLGWFIAFGILFGLFYGGMITLLIAKPADLTIGLIVGVVLGGIGGLGCGIINGLIAVVALQRPTMTWQKLTLLFLISVGMAILWLQSGLFGQSRDSVRSLYGLGIMALYILLPLSFVTGATIWIARWMVRWRERQTVS